jgi:hypothetical protein
MARYPRALKPNYALDRVNTFALNLGTPALAVANRFVVSTNMKLGAYTIANSGLPGDGCARNVTVTHTQVGGVTDTLGTVIVTGTDVNGATISETITPADGTIAAGTKAFKSVTSVVGDGWVINTGNDTIVVGFGTLVGIPAISGGNQAFWVAAIEAGTALVVTSSIGGTYQAATIAHDGTVPGTTFDLSAGTYNGSKRAFVLYAL